MLKNWSGIIVRHKVDQLKVSPNVQTKGSELKHYQLCLPTLQPAQPITNHTHRLIKSVPKNSPKQILLICCTARKCFLKAQLYSQYFTAASINYKELKVITRSASWNDNGMHQKQRHKKLYDPVKMEQRRRHYLRAEDERNLEKTSSRFMYEPWRGCKNNHRE